MPKITYEEFRPGHWVKKIDGEIVGPATAAEVAAWKQEKAAPTRIWQDVVATASRPPSGEVATASRPPSGEVATASRPPSDETTVAKPPTGKAGAPAQPGTPKEPSPSTVWEDLLKRSQRPVRAEGPPTPRPRKEDTDQAEQVQIWQDVVKRVKRPEPQPEPQATEPAPISPQPALAAKPEPAARTSAAPATTLAQTVPPAPTARPEAQSTKKAFDAEIVTTPAPTAVKPTVGAKVDRSSVPRSVRGRYSIPRRVQGEKAAPATEAPEQPMSKPAPPIERAVKAKAKSQRGRAQKVRATRAVAKEKPAVKATPAKTAAPSEPHRPAVKVKLPAKLLDEIAEQESAPVVKAVVSAPRREVSPSAGQKHARSRSKGSKTSIPRRTAGKGKTPPAQERPNQLYLWISAGQADDPVAAVRTGLARYQERFSHAAEVVLCHSSDLPVLEGAKLPVDIREGKSLAPRNFWIGSK